MSDEHEWCRDTARDEAVRAAEDAAAVPAIQHRDLPELVADLRERVARLEEEADATSDEAVAHGATLSALAEARESLAAANRGIARLTAERDAAIRERDAARAECERLRACADPFNEEMAVIAAWERCAITADWPADEPETAVRCAASMEREIVRLRARVAELEAAPPPRGWLTAEEREAVVFARDYYYAQTCGMNEDGGWYRLHKKRQLACESLLARSTPPRVKVPHLDDLESDERPVWESACREWIAAIRAAGGEVE